MNYPEGYVECPDCRADWGHGGCGTCGGHGYIEAEDVGRCPRCHQKYDRSEASLWRQGPPTAAGWYVCEYSDDRQPFYLVEEWPLDYGVLPVIYIRVARHLAITQPPGEEKAFN